MEALISMSMVIKIKQYGTLNKENINSIVF